MYCSVCHDSRGDGQGPVVSRGMLPPPSLKASRALTLSDGELFHVLTYGQGNMASYAAQLSVASIDPLLVQRWLTRER